MAVSGPLARTIEDLELGIQAMANHDHRDPWSVDMPLKGKPYLNALLFATRQRE